MKRHFVISEEKTQKNTSRNTFGFCSGAFASKPEHNFELFRFVAYDTGTLLKSVPVCFHLHRNPFENCSGLAQLQTGTLFGTVPVWKMRTLGPDGRPHSRRRRDEAGSSNPPPQPVGYPGGPSDLSLLVRYQDHVARRLWYGEERGSKKELKVAGHGTKLQERVPQQLPPEIEAIVSRSGLASLQRTSLTKIDVNLVSAFVERWHVETSSFHMPFGEMTITLDDVACLLHLPINGMFWYPHEHVTEQVAVDLGCELLGVDRHAMAVHVRSCRGAYYSLQWLYDRFVQYRAAGSWTYATRAYLMMLVGSTIFADKTFTLVEARYLLLFRDLRGLGSYSWASAALATLYRHLGFWIIFWIL
ncbi:protein MAIN-LIKE 1-like [Vicia villosa]|uniref:protein MAIN-LIKE 1-like n=1 Tax=Vicia villosa TaxID=3911 RepID=UPI00273BF715|nr:protein MAIN-LIKE 1-like [Vicia villosa]